MKHIAASLILTALCANQAVALSCLRPDVASAFQDASASDARYVILKGQFGFTPVPEKDPPEAETVEARFSGRLLTRTGFTQQVAAPVTIDLTCSGAWCATLDPNIEMIAFVEEKGADGLLFSVGPCYPFAFIEPTQEDTKRLENCAQGGACEPLPQDAG